ncbi:MAG TPA: Hsp33 family molecular chaperone HslO, partial [Savagea sp.]
QAIVGLGVDEISSMIEEDGKAEAECHFCMEKYEYSKEQLEQFLGEAREQDSKS